MDFPENKLYKKFCVPSKAKIISLYCKWRDDGSLVFSKLVLQFILLYFISRRTQVTSKLSCHLHILFSHFGTSLREKFSNEKVLKSHISCWMENATKSGFKKGRGNASLGVECENGGLVSADEKTGWQIAGHDLQPAHVEGVGRRPASSHRKGPEMT